VTLPHALIRPWAAALALLLCCLPATAQNDCLEVRGTPGCSSPLCSAAVCVTLPECCTVAWDSGCATEALFVCEGCGSTPESCVLPHPKRGCADAACCQDICALDDYCCNVEWDDNCALLAQINCEPAGPVPCGDPDAGSCTAPHPTPACNDAACCDQVCASWDPCCVTAWDSFCVSLAQSLCSTTCDPGCPTGSSQEIETCGSRTNDPVFRPGSPAGVPQAILRDKDVCGRLTVTPSLNDVDVYLVSLQGLDTDNDGLVKIRVLLTATSPMFAAVVPVNSAEAVLPLGARLTVNATGCGTSKGWTCVAPTGWWIVVARGTDGVISNSATDCDAGRYRLRVETDAACGDPCGAGSGDCFVPRTTPGCGDAACCATTCALLPDCCDIAWDTACVLVADENCGAPAPANDACASAQRIAEGAWPLSTLGATKDGDAVPAACRVAGADSTRDVWFRWQPARSGECQLDLCGATWDTRLELFTGPCGARVRVACADDSPFCNPARGSRLTFQAACEADYLIRVSGVADERGLATLTISTPTGPTCCSGDLDGSGTVDAADIGSLLTLFGAAGGPGDLDGSGSVDAADIGTLLTQFGPCS
jgi:hypothetical protein